MCNCVSESVKLCSIIIAAVYEMEMEMADDETPKKLVLALKVDSSRIYSIPLVIEQYLKKAQYHKHNKCRRYDRLHGSRYRLQRKVLQGDSEPFPLQPHNTMQ